MPQLTPPKAPSLPLATEEYERDRQNDFSNVLRLYFNQLDNAFRQLLLGFNNFGAFHSTVTQTNPVANAVNLVTFNTTDRSYGISIDTTVASRINVTKNGVYNFQFAAQLDHTGGGKALFYIWVRVNGVAVTYSAVKVRIGSNEETSTTWNHLTDLRSGDYVEFAWTSSDTAAVLLAQAAAAPVPAVPSATLAVTYVYPDNSV